MFFEDGELEKTRDKALSGCAPSHATAARRLVTTDLLARARLVSSAISSSVHRHDTPASSMWFLKESQTFAGCSKPS